MPVSHHFGARVLRFEAAPDYIVHSKPVKAVRVRDCLQRHMKQGVPSPHPTKKSHRRHSIPCWKGKIDGLLICIELYSNLDIQPSLTLMTLSTVHIVSSYIHWRGVLFGQPNCFHDFLGRCRLRTSLVLSEWKIKVIILRSHKHTAFTIPTRSRILQTDRTSFPNSFNLL